MQVFRIGLKQRKKKGESIMSKKMKGRACFFMILAVVVFWTSLAFGAETEEPSVNILANGSDGPITVAPGSKVRVEASFDAGTQAGVKADWWVVAHTPSGWYSYVRSKGWVYGLRPYMQGPLFNVSSAVLVNGSLSKGEYTFFFAVDTLVNGKVDTGWRDYVQVNVQEAVQPSPPPQDPGGSLLPKEKELIELINQERQKYNLPALNFNDLLVAAARRHSNDMAQNNFMSHTGSDGSSPSDRIKRTGYQPRTSGENVAAGYSTPQQVLNGWMNSSGHRANILGKFCDMGVGYDYNSNSRYGHYWTLNLGCR
jgi:uncharacterized protein YkwD